MRHALAVSVSVLSALITLCCASVLGIEDAKHDPRLDLKQQHDSGGQMSDSGTPMNDSGLAPLCDRYCDTVMANCTGVDAVYKTRIVCMDICAALEPGTAGDQEGNTVECRLSNANLAETTGETSAHCSNAGPGGNGVCGSNCDGYCTEMMSICEGKFATLDDCMTACATVPDLMHYDSSIQQGGTIQCRLYHVSAATQDAQFHCPHAAGESICVAPAMMMSDAAPAMMTDAAAHD